METVRKVDNNIVLYRGKNVDMLNSTSSEVVNDDGLPSSLEDAIENVISLQMQIHAELKDSSFTYIIVTPTAFFKSLGGQVEIACSEMVSCALRAGFSFGYSGLRVGREQDQSREGVNPVGARRDHVYDSWQRA
ncbi:hypothetical protein YC2023_027133 [Brassica napus]